MDKGKNLCDLISFTIIFYTLHSMSFLSKCIRSLCIQQGGILQSKPDKLSTHCSAKTSKTKTNINTSKITYSRIEEVKKTKTHSTVLLLN